MTVEVDYGGGQGYATPKLTPRGVCRPGALLPEGG